MPGCWLPPPPSSRFGSLLLLTLLLLSLSSLYLLPPTRQFLCRLSLNPLSAGWLWLSFPPSRL